MTFHDFRRKRKLGAFVLMGGLTLAQAVQAAEVTLRSSDGTVNMTGEFVDFQDNAYIIATALGEMRIAANRVSCIGAGCPQLNTEEADVVIAGADVIAQGMMPLLLEGYAGSMNAAAELGNLSNVNNIFARLTGEEGFGDEIGTFLVKATSSGEGIDELLAGTAEIGMSSRRIREDEASVLAANGAGDMFAPQQEHIIAVDSLVVITHPENPVTTLTSDQLQRIYSGQITNWNSVGGPNMPINIVGYPEGSSEREVFEERIFGDRAVRLASNAEIVDTNNDAAQRVNATPGAISFVGYAFQRGAKPLSLINECGIRMQPTAFAARTEEYALQRRLYLYTRADKTTDQSRALVEFATSSAADALINKSGFIGFGVDRQEQVLGGSRGLSLLNENVDAYEGQIMRQMVAQMTQHDRLSTTFRFATGSARLDERGRIDMARLIEYLEGQPQGTEVLMVGFTDDVGRFENNRILAEGRAAQVLDEIRAAGGNRLGDIRFRSVGYGEVAPSGCNADAEGRRINRRVEVWIKSPA